jgi:hypothetical protein
MKRFSSHHDFTFPYVIDHTQDIARVYGAQCTPNFLGFNSKDELQYRGRLDASRTKPVVNARRDLFEAIKQVADPGHGPKEQFPSMGCSRSGSTKLAAKTEATRWTQAQAEHEQSVVRRLLPRVEEMVLGQSGACLLWRSCIPRGNGDIRVAILPQRCRYSRRCLLKPIRLSA